MVLLKSVVEVAARPVPHMFAELGPDGSGIGIMAVGGDPIGRDARDRLGRSKECLGGCEVAVLAEHDVHQSAVAINRAIEILPPATHLDVRLVNKKAVQAAGVTFESGDAICLYMGRDEYERGSRSYGVVQSPDEMRPGIGQEGSRWLSERNVSLLLWDFMEASGPTESHVSVHVLIWAQGMILVDNCDLARARAALANRPTKAGLLSVAPLMLARATGCLVNPLLVI